MVGIDPIAGLFQGLGRFHLKVNAARLTDAKAKVSGGRIVGEFGDRGEVRSGGHGFHPIAAWRSVIIFRSRPLQPRARSGALTTRPWFARWRQVDVTDFTGVISPNAVSGPSGRIIRYAQANVPASLRRTVAVGPG